MRKDVDITMVILTASKLNRYTDRDWSRHFSADCEHRLLIDFSQETGLTAEERRLLFPSIRAFQRGEGSDGLHLLKAADAWVKAGGEPAYLEAIRGFIREENLHSAYLRQYMDHYHVEAARRSFSDRIFRRLRKLGGLKCEIIVLVTAEIIALSYYDALSNAVADSPALASICARMLRDELPHIIFQSHALRRLPKRSLDAALRWLLMEASLLYVWSAFHPVFRAGGYGYARLRRESLGYLEQSLSLSGVLKERTPKRKRRDPSL